MSESECPYSPHLVILSFRQDDVPVGVIGTTPEEVVALNHAVITLPQAEFSIVVQKGVVSVGVPAGLVGDHLGFTGIVVWSTNHGCPPSAAATTS